MTAGMESRIGQLSAGGLEYMALVILGQTLIEPRQAHSKEVVGSVISVSPPSAVSILISRRLDSRLRVIASHGHGRVLKLVEMIYIDTRTSRCSTVQELNLPRGPPDQRGPTS